MFRWWGLSCMITTVVGFNCYDSSVQKILGGATLGGGWFGRVTTWQRVAPACAVSTARLAVNVS